MNLENPAYNRFALVKEMLETGEVVRKLDISAITDLAEKVQGERYLLTGEGSSRIFPAKKIIQDALQNDWADILFTEAATQALDYQLGKTSVFVASNSGKTKEGVRLIRQLRQKGCASITGLVANASTPIVNEADRGHILCCGKEDAVAATKSVVEQALFYDLLFRARAGAEMPDLQKLGDLIDQVLLAQIPEEIITPLEKAPVLFWAGRNNGVAEELTLKTNEITRKKSDFLEGTYAVHGIEEVMNAPEAVIAVDPFEAEEGKFSEVLKDGVGLDVVAISTRQTSFPTLLIPNAGEFTNYLELAAGWSLLVEVGVRTGIDLDKPERARKVGNEFPG